mgnify:CR=1 FL=1
MLRSTPPHASAQTSAVQLPPSKTQSLSSFAGIPDLPRSLLPRHAAADSVALLRRWLLLPPRPFIADSVRTACRELAAATAPLPLLRPVPVGKLSRLLQARQANPHFFADLSAMLEAVEAAMRQPSLAEVNCAVLNIAAEEAGEPFPLTAEALAAASSEARHDIDSLLSLRLFLEGANDPKLGLTALASDDDVVEGDEPADLVSVTGEPAVSDPGAWLLPSGFVDANEVSFKGLLQRGRAPSEEEELAIATVALAEALSAELPDGYTVVHAARDNDVFFQRILVPKASARSKANKAVEQQVPPAGQASTRRLRSPNPDGMAVLETARDRLGRKLEGRYTTPRVREARLRYLRACDEMEAAVRREMQVWAGPLGEGLVVPEGGWSWCTAQVAPYAASH